MARITRVAQPPWGDHYLVDEDGDVVVKTDDYHKVGHLNTHDADRCAGEFCPLHNPSDHPLKDADMTLRLDKGGLIERRCEHGVGHDDPDSVAWLIANVEGSAEWAGVHGCDGCCSGITFDG